MVTTFGLVFAINSAVDNAVSLSSSTSPPSRLALEKFLHTGDAWKYCTSPPSTAPTSFLGSTSLTSATTMWLPWLSAYTPAIFSLNSTATFGSITPFRPASSSPPPLKYVPDVASVSPTSPRFLIPLSSFIGFLESSKSFIAISANSSALR